MIKIQLTHIQLACYRDDSAFVTAVVLHLPRYNFEAFQILDASVENINNLPLLSNLYGEVVNSSVGSPW